MANLYEVTEKLTAIKAMIASEQKARPALSKTPDGKPPAYYPNTVHGKSGMLEFDTYKNDPIPPKG